MSRVAPQEHPRSRGENTVTWRRNSPPPGTSPLARGKPAGVKAAEQNLRNIPARAGKTFEHQCIFLVFWEHPRSRGENIPMWSARYFVAGTSPLARGKHSALRRPQPNVLEHPRSRGENETSFMTVATKPGTSPLARGKPSPQLRRAREQRNIPARAGKTCDVMQSLHAVKEHPRSRGENCALLDGSRWIWGTSPLARGKQPPVGASLRR